MVGRRSEIPEVRVEMTVRAFGWIPHLSDSIDPGIDISLDQCDGSDVSGSLVFPLTGDPKKEGISMIITPISFEMPLRFRMDIRQGGESIRVNAEIDSSGLISLFSETSDGCDEDILFQAFMALRDGLSSSTSSLPDDDGSDPADWMGPVYSDNREDAIREIERRFLWDSKNKLMEMSEGIPSQSVMSNIESMLLVHPLFMSKLERIGGTPMSSGELDRLDDMLSASGFYGIVSVSGRKEVTALRKDIERIDEHHRLMSYLYSASIQQIRYGMNFCRIMHGEMESKESSAVLMNYAAAIEDAYSSYRDEESHSASKVAERSGSYALENAQMTKVLTYAVIVLTVTSVVAALV